MKNKLIVGIVLIVGLLIGTVFLKNQKMMNEERMSQPTPSMEKTDDSMTEPTDEMMQKTDDNTGTMKKDEGTMMKKESRYVMYSQSAFAAAADKKRVLFFHAPWCPTCRPADAAFQKDAISIPEEVMLFKTDYDSSTDLKKKYGVTYQHTFVQVDARGDEVTSWNGGQLTELIAKIK